MIDDEALQGWAPTGEMGDPAWQAADAAIEIIALARDIAETFGCTVEEILRERLNLSPAGLQSFGKAFISNDMEADARTWVRELANIGNPRNEIFETLRCYPASHFKSNGRSVGRELLYAAKRGMATGYKSENIPAWWLKVLRGRPGVGVSWSARSGANTEGERLELLRAEIAKLWWRGESYVDVRCPDGHVWRTEIQPASPDTAGVATPACKCGKAFSRYAPASRQHPDLIEQLRDAAARVASKSKVTDDDLGAVISKIIRTPTAPGALPGFSYDLISPLWKSLEFQHKVLQQQTAVLRPQLKLIGSVMEYVGRQSWAMAGLTSPSLNGFSPADLQRMIALNSAIALVSVMPKTKSVV